MLTGKYMSVWDNVSVKIGLNLLIRNTNQLTIFYVNLNRDRKWAKLNFFFLVLPLREKKSTYVGQQGPLKDALQIRGSQRSLFCSHKFSSFESTFQRIWSKSGFLTRCRIAALKKTYFQRTPIIGLSRVVSW